MYMYCWYRKWGLTFPALRPNFVREKIKWIQNIELFWLYSKCKQAKHCNHCSFHKWTERIIFIYFLLICSFHPFKTKVCSLCCKIWMWIQHAFFTVLYFCHLESSKKVYIFNRNIWHHLRPMELRYQFTISHLHGSLEATWDFHYCHYMYFMFFHYLQVYTGRFSLLSLHVFHVFSLSTGI